VLITKKAKFQIFLIMAVFVMAGMIMHKSFIGQEGIIS
jgi:hypothetical protein